MNERLHGECQTISFKIELIMNSLKKDSMEDLSSIYSQFIEKFNKYIESCQSTYRNDIPVFTAANDYTERLDKAIINYTKSGIKVTINLLLTYNYNDIIFNYDKNTSQYDIEGLLSESQIKEKLINPFKRFLTTEFMNHDFTIISNEAFDIQYNDASDVYDSISYFLGK